MTYTISFRYSRDGRTWSSSNATVKATSDEGAIIQVQSKYPYVSDIKIKNVR